MSNELKKGDKSGTVHKKTRQQPSREEASAVIDKVPDNKPDFDKKDLGVTPQRKSPGPVQKRRRANSGSRNEAVTVAPNPEVKIQSKQKPSVSSGHKK